MTFTIIFFTLYPHLFSFCSLVLMNSGDGVFLPPHFYGELAKTKEGCDVLDKSGHIPQFIATVQNQNEATVERRAVLWALVRITAIFLL